MTKQQNILISLREQQPISFDVEIKPLNPNLKPLKAKVIPVISLGEVIRYKVISGTRIAVMLPYELSHLIESKQYKIA